MKKVLLSFALSLGFVQGSFAEETATVGGESSVQATDVKPAEKEKEAINNARMAAEAGSKSKLSMKLTLGYNGGSLEKPLDRLRPNYRGVPGQLQATTMGGSVAMAYRLDSSSSLRFGTGVSMRTPFHNSITELTNNKSETSKTNIFNVSNPYLEYNRTFKSGNFIHSPSVTYTQATDSHYTDTMGLNASVSASWTSLLDMSGSNWQPGVAVSAGYSFYADTSPTFLVTRKNPNTNVEELVPEQRDSLGLGIYPFLEYVISDTYSFRTVFGYFNYAMYRGSDDIETESPYQSVGIGIAPREGLYIYPNLQFRPDNVRADMTNIAVSVTFNTL